MNNLSLPYKMFYVYTTYGTAYNDIDQSLTTVYLYVSQVYCISTLSNQYLPYLLISFYEQTK